MPVDLPLMPVRSLLQMFAACFVKQWAVCDAMSPIENSTVAVPILPITYEFVLQVHMVGSIMRDVQQRLLRVVQVH